MALRVGGAVHAVQGFGAAGVEAASDMESRKII